MAFNTSSIWIKVALICLLLGTILFVIGFSTMAWYVIGSSQFGLWRWRLCHSIYRCDTYSVNSHDLAYRDWTAWYRATQVFECIGLICIVLAFFIILLFVFVDRMKKRSPLLAIIAFSFVAAISMVIGFIIFGTQFDDYMRYSDVGWSMGLAIAASILAFIAGVMALIDLKK